MNREAAALGIPVTAFSAAKPALSIVNLKTKGV